MESIQCNPHLFSESGGSGLGVLTPNCARRLSDISIQSGMSGLTDALSLQAINQRIDMSNLFKMLPISFCHLLLDLKCKIAC